MSKIAYIGGVVLAVCAGVGWALHGSNSANDSGATAGVQAPQLQNAFTKTGPAAPSIDAVLLRAIIREELAAAARASGGGNVQQVREAVQTTAPAPVTPELLEQREVARQTIDSMIASGVWSNESRLTFQQKLAFLSPEQAQQALQQVTVGLNNGTIQATTDGPPI